LYLYNRARRSAPGGHVARLFMSSPEKSMPSTSIPRRRLAATVSLALLASIALPTWAQDRYPSRPVRLVIAFPPGGAVDGAMRDLAARLSTLWGQPVIVDSKPGGNGVIAADIGAKAQPDGYTLFANYDGVATVVPFMQDKLPYDPQKDFKHIGMVSGLPLLLVASPSANINSLAELIAAAKTRPDALEYGSNGIGGTPHMAMEYLQRAAGIRLRHIPYKGSAAVMQDMLGGRVGLMWGAVSSVMAQVKAGKLIPIAYGSRQRSPLLPQVPTVAELGYPGFEAISWVGLSAPVKTPDAVVQKINADLQKVLHDPTFVEQQVARGNEVRGGSSEEFARQIRLEYERNKALFATGAIPKE
jgi:tripartite-type tricarboxylate transporter receptor subunit TctC